MPDTATTSPGLSDASSTLRQFTPIRDHQTVFGLAEIAASLEQMASDLHRRAGDPPSHLYRRAALNMASSLNSLRKAFEVRHGLALHAGPRSPSPSTKQKK